jgi:hypothetical protein
MRFAFIAKHRNIWPVAWLCDALDVSRSGFHAWLNRSPSARSRHDEVLVTAIDRSFKSSDRTYGARRVWHDVLAEGLSCGLHRKGGDAHLGRSQERYFARDRAESCGAGFPFAKRLSVYEGQPDAPVA